MALEGLLRPIRGTRSAYYERNTGGLYLDIIPDRDALARYGLTVGDLERVVEAAIGGAPIGFTVEGRNRFTINVRYPQDLRGDLERLRRVLVPVGGGGGGGSGAGAATGASRRVLPGADGRWAAAGRRRRRRRGAGLGGDAPPTPSGGWLELAAGPPPTPGGSGGPAARAASCRWASSPRCASPAARP